MTLNPEWLAELDRRGRDFGPEGVFQYRADTKLNATDNRQLNGYSLVFNRLSQDLGGFIEEIAPEFVNRTLREGLDVFALFNHDWQFVLGRTSSGTSRMEKDTYGLRVMTDPPDPIYPANLLESIRRRDITGMSFAFITLEDNWDFKQDPPRRTLLDGKIIENSVVPRPAYLDTSIGVRAFQEVAKHHGFAWKPSLKFRERELRARDANR